MHSEVEQSQVFFFGGDGNRDAGVGDAGNRMVATDDPDIGGDNDIGGDGGGSGDNSSRLMYRDFSLVSPSFPRKRSGAESSLPVAVGASAGASTATAATLLPESMAAHWLALVDGRLVLARVLGLAWGTFGPLVPAAAAFMD